MLKSPVMAKQSKSVEITEMSSLKSSKVLGGLSIKLGNLEYLGQYRIQIWNSVDSYK